MPNGIMLSSLTGLGFDWLWMTVGLESKDKEKKTTT